MLQKGHVMGQSMENLQDDKELHPKLALQTLGEFGELYTLYSSSCMACARTEFRDFLDGTERH